MLPIAVTRERLAGFGSALRQRLGIAPRRARLERFGAIVELRRPHALVFVDRTYARRLGISPPPANPIWANDEDGAIGRSVLSAPLEAHLQLTARCDAGCRGCYTASTPHDQPGQWGAREWKCAIDELATMGVFHLALGGGESASLPWLGEVAAHARRRNMIPNLTTSGLAGLERLLPIANLFGQINVSLDGIGEAYSAVRGFDGFAAADRAIRQLRRVKSEVGINVVVTRVSFGQIDQLFTYARRRRLNEIELLRFKPAGRGRSQYADLCCTDPQHRLLLPTILAACRRHHLRAHLDCSYLPMIAYHRPAPELLSRLAVYGCAGGDLLVGATASGVVTGCSFAEPPRDRPTVDELPSYWKKPHSFAAFREWRKARGACKSCEYHYLCRGGCKAVSRHLLGNTLLPDPECPRVVDSRRATVASNQTGESL